jgi:hypothetical protein
MRGGIVIVGTVPTINYIDDTESSLALNRKNEYAKTRDMNNDE